MIISCTTTASSTDCDVPFLSSVDAGDGRSFYVNEIWTAGDMAITFLLLTFLMIYVAKVIHDFIFN